MLLDSDQPNAALSPGGSTDTHNPGNRLAPRLALLRVPLLVFIAAVALYALHNNAIYAAMSVWGVYPPVDYPFLDLQFIFAGAECWAKGVNVYVADPCDVLNRFHTYSPLWLRFGLIPQSWTPAAGIIVDGAFVLSLLAFPPPRRSRELLVLLLAALSPPVVFALQRANVDVIIYLMVLGAAALWARSAAQRGWAYAFILFAGLLKYYPLVVLGLAVRERLKRCLAIFALSAIVLVAFVFHFHDEVLAAAANIPTGPYLMGDLFGAKQLPGGLAAILGVPETGIVPLAVAGLLGLLCGAGIFSLMRWRDLRRTVLALEPFETALLLFGGGIIAGCFFAGQNVGYRGVLLLLFVPGLLALWRRGGKGAVARFAKTMTLLTLFLMWQSVLTWNDRFLGVLQTALGASAGEMLWNVLWLARELGWWTLATGLAGIVAGFVLQSDALAWLFARRAGMAKP